MRDENQHVLAFNHLLELRRYARARPDGAGRFVAYCAANLMHSSSQLLQDLFVVFCLNGKRDGFFVEFGAADGLLLSNTLLLERAFQWKGILAEPAKGWHAALAKNRSAAIETRCVWSETGVTFKFKETLAAEYSTMTELVDKDFNRPFRQEGKTYAVETISLNDLLRLYHSPKTIDYLSIDTEGSELAILRPFAFNEYNITVITVEHNYCEPDRREINALLAANGFVRVFEALSKFDDWYVKRSLLSLPQTTVAGQPSR
jgi:FkbM family methyltransferase